MQWIERGLVSSLTLLMCKLAGIEISWVIVALPFGLVISVMLVLGLVALLMASANKSFAKNVVESQKMDEAIVNLMKNQVKK